MTGDAERSEDELTAHVNDAQRCMFGIGMAGTAVAYTTVRGLIAGIQRLTAERDAAVRDLAELRETVTAQADRLDDLATTDGGDHCEITWEEAHILSDVPDRLRAALAASGSVTAGEQT